MVGVVVTLHGRVKEAPLADSNLNRGDFTGATTKNSSNDNLSSHTSTHRQPHSFVRPTSGTVTSLNRPHDANANEIVSGAAEPGVQGMYGSYHCNY